MVHTVATGVTSQLDTLLLDPMVTTRLATPHRGPMVITQLGILLRAQMVTSLWDAHRQAQVGVVLVVVTMGAVAGTVKANEPTQ